MAIMQREREGLINSWDIGGGYNIEFHRWLPDSDPNLLRPLQERAAWVNSKVFPINPLQTSEEILHHMKRGLTGSIMIATIDQQDVGICIQNMVRIPLSGQRTENVIWNALRAVEENHQGRGLATLFLEKSFKAYRDLLPRRGWPHYYSGRSHTEPIFLSLEKAEVQASAEEKVKLFDRILPIAELYQDGSDEQQILWHLAFRAVHSVIVDKNTGVAKAVYPEGRRGGFSPDLTNPGYRRIHKLFDTYKLDQDRGDTLYYLARINPTLFET